jgi:outer membrane protein TolC
MQAEQQLRAAEANIGAARAAMWPRITLSASAGSVSNELSNLFSAGTFAWTLAGQAAVAVFDHGRNRANVQVAEISRDAAVASYQKTVQTAFKEAADGLSGQTGWREQLAAQRAQLAAEAERHRLSKLKYDVGAISLLDWLDAERSLASAQQALVQVQLAELLNRVSLYKALGGDESARAAAVASATAASGAAR